MSNVQPPAGRGGRDCPESAIPARSPAIGRSRRSLRNRSGSTGKTSRAGRDLPAAVVVGVALLVSVLVGLLFLPIAVVVLATVFGALGVWEVCRALEVRSIRVPLVPVIAGSVVLPFAAYLGGAEGLAFALVAAATAVLLWRSLDPAEDAARSVASGLFVLLWIPFLLSFAMLLFMEPQGNLLVAALLLLVVANDTFGYLIGAFFGRHPMAPKISPKKSWEGFGGSVGGAVLVGILAAIFLLNLPWWFGLALAVATVAASTGGDLAESMIKRELGIKDMGTMLPGHGGVMDRLDSIVFASPIVYLVSTALVPGLG